MSRKRPSESNGSRSEAQQTSVDDGWVKTGTGPFYRRLHPGWLGLLLVLLVAAVYSPNLRHGFVYLDDSDYVSANGWVLNGITGEGVAWAFRTTHMGNWHPLTWLSYQLDVEWCGANPGGHHLTNIVLHALNAGLVFFVFLKMTRRVWSSWLVAALFGLHPLHVESVAWIAERKDVLSALWWLLSLWAYVHWCQARAANRPHPVRWYALTLLFFTAGLMSKPMVVTLPCVLLLLDYWPLRRMSGGIRPVGFGTLFFEKIPFFILSAAASVITVLAQADAGAVSGLDRLPWDSRVLNAIISYTEYLGKFLYPVDLAAIYPYPDKFNGLHAGISGVLLLAVTVLGWVRRRTSPYLLVGWLAYLGMLVPVIGLVQVGNQALADRYTYLPLLGIFLGLVWGLADLSLTWRSAYRRLLGGITVGLLALLAVMTVRQLEHWQSGETLARRALAVAPKNWTAHMIMGYYAGQDPARLDEAIAHYRAATRLSPENAEARMSLVVLLAQRPAAQAEAMAEAQVAMKLKPTTAWGYFTLGKALRDMAGKSDEAVEKLMEAVRRAPMNGEFQTELAATLARLPGRAADAIVAYRRAIQMQPDRVELRNDLGTQLVRIPGALDEAISEYQFVIQTRPEFPDAHNNLANVLRSIPGRELEAVAAYEKALQLLPASNEIEYNLGTLLAGLPGHEAEAMAHFEAILRSWPDWKPADDMRRYLQAKRNAAAP